MTALSQRLCGRIRNRLHPIVEIVAHSYSYEGATTSIYVFEAEKAKPVLAVECGV